MYISIHEPKGIIHIESEASFKAYTKDKIIIEAAGGMVFNEKNELLMIFRRGFWDLPKGKIDPGETGLDHFMPNRLNLPPSRLI